MAVLLAVRGMTFATLPSRSPWVFAAAVILGAAVAALGLGAVSA